MSGGPDRLPRAANSRLRSFLGFIRCYLRFALLRGRLDAHSLALISTSGYFDPAYYLQTYQDIEQAGADPLIHYKDFGANEQRNPSAKFNTAFYRWQLDGALDARTNPLVHFLRHGRRRGLQPTRKKTIEACPEHSPGGASIEPIGSASPLRNSRCVVFTAIVGDYDDLQPLRFVAPNCEFVAFSDRPRKVDGWTILPLNYFHADPTRAARFVKLHPHLYFPDCDRSIWIDANLAILGDVSPFLDALTPDCFVSAFRHPLRGCVYDEAIECVSLRKDDLGTIFQQLRKYKLAGVQEDMGLWETNVLVRRHNDPRCISLMSAWWKEIETGSRRDQIGFPVVARAQGVRIAPLGAPGDSAGTCPLLAFRAHNDRAGPYTLDQLPETSTASAAGGPLTIGICVHNSLPDVERCLASAIAARRSGDRIIIVDDASDDETAGFLLEFSRQNDGVELIRNAQNLGYTRSANIIFGQASTEWIILLNSDAITPPGTLHKLVAAGEQFPRLAIVGPLSNAGGWQTVPRMVGDDGQFLVNDLPPGMSPADMEEICERTSNNAVLFVPLVNGFCLAIRKSALHTIGPFDAQSFPIAYGEEDDLCLRAADKGYVCGIATNAYVYHAKSASFTAARRQTLVSASAIALRQRHGAERLAASVATMRNHPALGRLRTKLAIALNSGDRASKR